MRNTVVVALHIAAHCTLFRLSIALWLGKEVVSDTNDFGVGWRVRRTIPGSGGGLGE